MSTALNELTSQALALPTAERVSLAQQLWESIHGAVEGNLPQSVADAVLRDDEISNGSVTTVSHAEVMRQARAAL